MFMTYFIQLLLLLLLYMKIHELALDLRKKKNHTHQNLFRLTTNLQNQGNELLKKLGQLLKIKPIMFIVKI